MKRTTRRVGKGRRRRRNKDRKLMREGIARARIGKKMERKGREGMDKDRDRPIL